MIREWEERRIFESTEQRVSDQARAITKNGWLSKRELEAVKRQVKSESKCEICREQNKTVETEAIDVGTFEEEIIM